MAVTRGIVGIGGVRQETGTTTRGTVVGVRQEVAAGGTAYVLTADKGTVTYSGASAALLFNRKLTSDKGTLDYSGASASVLFSRLLAASPGTVDYLGAAASLNFGRALSAAPGSVDINGASASLLRTFLVAASPGSITYQGAVATLTYTTAGAFVLTANPGTVDYQGAQATLKLDRLLAAASGSIDYAGASASLLMGRVLQGSPGSVTYQGASADLIHNTPNKILVASPGSITYQGAIATLLYTPAGLSVPSSGGGGGKIIRVDELPIFRHIDKQLKEGRRVEEILEDLRAEVPRKVVQKKGPRITVRELPPPKVAPDTMRLLGEIQSVAQDATMFRRMIEEAIRTEQVELERWRQDNNAALLLLLAGVL